MNRKKPFYIPGQAALLFLHIALPLITLEGIVILISYLIAREADVLLAFDTWSPALFDFLAAILVAVLLAIVTDAIELEQKKKSRDK